MPFGAASLKPYIKKKKKISKTNTVSFAVDGTIGNEIVAAKLKKTIEFY